MSADACLEFFRLRLTYRAVNPLVFPAGKPGTVLRGGFGTMLKALAPEETYRRLFEPLPEHRGPSGYSERARPFTFRAAHLDDKAIEAGAEFWFDFHLFETRQPMLDTIHMAFAQLGREGMGAGRGRAELIAMRELDSGGKPVDAAEPVRVPLLPGSEPVRRVSVEFITPTELKSRGALMDEPLFYVLLARARDRVSALRSLSGVEPLDIDYKCMGDRARLVRMTRCELRHVDATRRSSRTGQRHPVGGFVGQADYEGELTEFLPWLVAAQYTGVGRQTGFGKGEILVSARD